MKTTEAWTDYCKSLAPAIVECCTHTSTGKGEDGLIRALAAARPELKFRHALCRAGWYRLGGLVEGCGARVSDDLAGWAEAELAARGGDFAALEEDFAGRDLHATRLVGKTHYFVAPTGDEPDDFLQLEVEEIQEVRAHPLFGHHPGSLEELIDPDGPPPSQVALGLPCYRFRRIQHMGDFLVRMRAPAADPAPIHRMIADWAASSADAATNYCNHWVVSTREHLDRYRQPVFHAQPIAARGGEPPEFNAAADSRGIGLAGALTRFDRAAGYPMAWYFHMLTTRAVPFQVAQAVVEDALAGFAYLPPRDVDLVRSWLHRPYAI